MADIAYSDFVTSTGTDTSNGTGATSVTGGQLIVTSGTGAGNRGQRRLNPILSTMGDGDVLHVQAVDTGGGQFTCQIVINFTVGTSGDFRPALSWLGNRWGIGYVNRTTPGDAAGVTLAPADGKMFARIRRSGAGFFGETSATAGGPYTTIATLNSSDGYWSFDSFAITDVLFTADDRGTPASSYIFEQVGTVAPAPPAYTPPPVVTNPNVDYITGVTLDPITVRVYDQYGALFTAFVGTCTVSSLTLPSTVTGTLTVPYVAGVATFSDLVPTGEPGPVIIPPVITSFLPLSGEAGTVVTIQVNTDAPLASVSFNGTPSSTFARINGTTVNAVLPSLATSGPITVVASNGTAVSVVSFFVTVPTPTPTGFVEVIREVPAYTHPSVLRIANLALQRVGATKLIASLDEQSKEARTIRQSWDHLRDLVLSEFPWGFATTYAALPVLDVTRRPWSYCYRMPADCLFPLGLEVQAHVTQLQDLIPFECQADESGPVLVTDHPDAVLRYLKRLIDPLDWPIWFHELMAWRLASELAMPLTVLPVMKQSVDQGLAQARIMAAQRAATAGQAPAQPFPSAFVTARGGISIDNTTSSTFR